MNEKYFDELLNVHTESSKSDVNNSVYYHPYEPTPYEALELLFQHYTMNSHDHVVDFGCGKGRLNFYIDHQIGCSVTGIEMNPSFYQYAIQNKKSYLKKKRKKTEAIQFLCCKAEEYNIQELDNRFYFFNPFTIPIFMKVVHNILRSFENNNREIDLILYYASDDYRYFLEFQTPFECVNEISLPGIYDKNTYERFLIYRAK